MRIAFYITNHGYGHASRNVPIIEHILQESDENRVFIKSDAERCAFLQRNLLEYADRIQYFDHVKENGLILKPGEMHADLDCMKKVILQDFAHWDDYVRRECNFMREYEPDVVVVDIVAWALKAAKQCGIRSVLIGNFDWAQVYRGYYSEEIWRPYFDCYQMADCAIWYELASEELNYHNANVKRVSLVSRRIDWQMVEQIRSIYKQPIVFVSLGASAEIERTIDVSDIPFDFVCTRGIKLTGDNVHILPMDMTNTPDYIAASEMVIAKGGWSTVAEILLLKKPCALLMRGDNEEDNHNRHVLEQRQHCVALNGDELNDIQKLLERIQSLKPKSYEIYTNDVDKICEIIME